MLASVIYGVRYRLSFSAKSLPLLIAGTLAFSGNAYAITMDQCSTQFREFVEASNYTFGEEYSQEVQNELLHTGAINFDFINSFQPEEASDLAENARAYSQAAAGGDAESDPDLARVRRAEVATINCIFEKKLVELSSGAQRSGRDIASPSDPDDGEDSSVQDNRTTTQARSDDGYEYDDFNHSQCISVEALPPGGSGSEMAYGHYLLKNACAYPVKLLTCFAFDRADGTPSPNYDRHADGEKCPGMGWGGTTLAANQMKDEREWYEYNNIKWEVKACQEGWDFIGPDGRYPSGILGEKYRCRRRAT